ncbi:hypothetical protein ACTFIV_011189 [Dictyostelium citrinum]
MDIDVEHDHPIKILLSGDTGKTSFINRAIDDIYFENSIFRNAPKIKFENDSNNSRVNTYYYENLIYYINFSEYFRDGYRQIGNNPYRGARTNFILFNVCDQESFDNVPRYYSEAIRYGREDIHIILIGVGIDDIENRVIDYEVALELANSNDSPYFEVNNKSPSPLEKEIYQRIIETAIKRVHDEINCSPSTKIQKVPTTTATTTTKTKNKSKGISSFLKKK